MNAQSFKLKMPTIFVIFGATGDLMARKVLPALFHLYITDQLPERFRIVGFSRRAYSGDDFRQTVFEALEKHKNTRHAPARKKQFAKLVEYVQGDFNARDSYGRLAAELQKIDMELGVCTSKLFHLAVPPHMYETILTHLARSGAIKGCGPGGGWLRVIVEKPFGKDLKTAEALDAMLGKLFREGQIYRIDHYLGKAMLHNILAFRFSNRLFEKSWNRDSVAEIQIRLNETLAVEGRGAFYDGVGALRDVGQNHILQMLALTTMDAPPKFDAAGIREKRYEILRTLKPFSRKEITLNTFRAQYKGYKNEPGVAQKSDTETYFRMRVFLHDKHWRGVPIILESGKKMGEVRKEVRVVFKHPEPCLCTVGTKHEFKNEVVFELEPKESIRIRFWVKKPGLTMELEEREFYLDYHEKRVGHVEEYAKLLYDCIAGDQTLFVSTSEVRAMWRFIDPIARAWQRNVVRLNYY